MFDKKTKDMEENEKTCTYALSRILNYEPRVARALIRNMGSAREVMKLSRDELEGVMGPYGKYTEAIAGAQLQMYAEQLQDLQKRGCRYITMNDECFPELLNECEDGPAGLFVRSDDSLENIFPKERISIVGTRDISPYGREWCAKIVADLSRSSARPSIVSGLAFGVDITAHLSALENGLPTIAVLGTGITDIYPSSHTQYAERIIHSPGCAVISEYPPQGNVTAVNFLSRNRIIAGLSRCTVLIESKIKGGGMSTARMAYSYDRDVFALPGRNDDIRSQGCNLLIHSNIATPLIGSGEFFKALGYSLDTKAEYGVQAKVRDYYKGSMDEVNIRQCEILLGHIRRERGIQAFDLAAKTGLAMSCVNMLLQRLENDGFIIVDLLGSCSILRKNG